MLNVFYILLFSEMCPHLLNSCAYVDQKDDYYPSQNQGYFVTYIHLLAPSRQQK